MCKIQIHIKWLKPLGLCLLALFFASAGFAQDETLDSVAIEAVPQDGSSPIQTESTNNFDKVDSEAFPAQIRKLSDSSVSRVKRDEDYWYANLVPEKNKKEQEARSSDSKNNTEKKSVSDSGWFNTLFWIIIVGGFVAILIWYLRSSDIHLFRKPSKVVSDTGDETITEDIFELDYDKEIAAAIAAQNFRLATRLMYLRTLRELSDRGLIQYKNERTNSDYLFQLAGTSFYNDFFRLTRDFEYTWYGEFALSTEAFAIVQKDFSSFKQKLA